MNKLGKEQIKKIGQYLIPSLKRKAIFYIFFLLIVCVIIAGAVFYANVVNPPKAESNILFIQINKNLFQTVYDRLQTRETNIQQGIGQEYPDVFK